MKETQGIFPQEFFDALFVEALGDLRKSGFKEKEVFSIIEDQFGVKYARQFCRQETQKGDSDKWNDSWFLGLLTVATAANCGPGQDPKLSSHALYGGIDRPTRLSRFSVIP